MAVDFAVCCDHQRRTCIQVRRRNGVVKFIPLDASAGLRVHQMTEALFDNDYKPIPAYPIKQAVGIFIDYGKFIGATKEALGFLGQIININEEEFTMPKSQHELEKTKKKAAAAEVAGAKRKTPKAGKPAAAAGTGKNMGVGKMISDLIMAGKYTDEEIFKKASEKFALDEKKKGYVQWYRYNLKRKGQNPPAPVVKKSK